MKMDNFEFVNRGEYEEDESAVYIKDLQNRFQKKLDINVEIEFNDSTYEIDEDGFRLTFGVEDDYLTILNIEVVDVENGLGKKIIETMHEFADEYDLEVRARQVKPEAIGFWKKLGYEEGSEEMEYFLIK